MKKKLNCAVFACALSAAALSHAEETRLSVIEVPIQHVFIPGQGFDDNDNVQALVVGELPDPCYVLGSTEMVRLAPGRLALRQTAWRRSGGVCGSGDPGSEVAYKTEFSLGKLEAGNYELLYRSDLSRTTTRTRLFKVDKSPAPTKDSFNYAPVSNVIADEVVWDFQEVKVALTGILNFSCWEIKEPVQWTRLDDVFVVLPLVAKNGLPCIPGLYPFQTQISVGKLNAGVYDFHVRTRGGNALNKLMFVAKNPK